MLLYYYTISTLLLQHCSSTVLLYYYIILSLYYCSTVVILNYCSAEPLYFCSTVLLQLCTTVVLQCCNVVVVQYCYCVVLYCSTLPYRKYDTDTVQHTSLQHRSKKITMLKSFIARAPCFQQKCLFFCLAKFQTFSKTSEIGNGGTICYRSYKTFEK